MGITNSIVTCTIAIAKQNGGRWWAGEGKSLQTQWSWTAPLSSLSICGRAALSPSWGGLRPAAADYMGPTVGGLAFEFNWVGFPPVVCTCTRIRTSSTAQQCLQRCQYSRPRLYFFARTLALECPHLFSPAITPALPGQWPQDRSRVSSPYPALHVRKKMIDINLITPLLDINLNTVQNISSVKCILTERKLLTSIWSWRMLQPPNPIALAYERSMQYVSPPCPHLRDWWWHTVSRMATSPH